MSGTRKIRYNLFGLFIVAILMVACGDAATSTSAPAATKAPVATTAAVTTAAPTTSVATTAALTTAAPTTAIATTIAPTTAAPTTVAATTAAVSTSTFKTFTSDEGRFSASFPAAPKQDKQVITVSGVSVDLILFTVVNPNDSSEYYVTYADYPAAILNQGTEALLNSVRDGQVKSISGTIQSENSIKVDTAPGKELEISGSGSHASVRNLLAGNRLYQLLVVGPEGKQSTQNIQTFMTSFRITTIAVTAGLGATPIATTAAATVAATTAAPATGFDGVLDRAQEIEPDPAIVQAFSAVGPSVPNLIVKMYVSPDSAANLAGALDSTLIKSGFKFALPGQTKLNKIGTSSYGGFYAAASQPDILLASTELTSDFDQTVKNLDELAIPGMDKADLNKLFTQLSGKKSLMIVVTGTDLIKALNP